MAFCQNCGAQLHGVSKFCPNCGTPVPVLEKPAAAPVQPEMPPIQAEPPAAEPIQTAPVFTAVPENEPAPPIPPQEPVVQQPVPQQAAYQPPAPQQPVYQQPAYQQSVPPQAAYQQPVSQQTMYQPSAPQQPAYQQPMPQQAAYQQPAPQQPAYQQPGSQSQVPPVHPGYQQPVQAAAPNQAQMKKGMAILAYFGILVLIPLLTAKQDPFARYHIPLPKNDFRRWNDDGREWREALLQCSALERFLLAAGGRPAREIYRKNACLRVVQSRHIRHSDRAEPKGSYYTNRFKVNCPSCGAVIELNSQQVTCPYCGGVIESDFYDWQTEVFELYEEMGNDLGMALLLLSSAVILFVSVFLCLWLIEDTQISLAAGVGAAVLVVVGIFTLTALGEKRQKKLAGKIVRYSENYLRSCIHEALYREAGSDLLDYSVGRIILKKVTHTAEITSIRAKVRIHEIYLPMGKKPYTKKRQRTLTLQRARYPEKRKADGSFLIERECPSCGANFVPDEHHCCSFCGYGLQTANARWVVQKGRK